MFDKVTANKKISIIVPCYNVEEYIDACIESILHQTIGMEHIELILVNDASTDTTVEHIIKYAEQFPDSIIFINLEENVRQANARNIGMDMATAEYLVFVDSDDWIREDFCEKALAVTEIGTCDLIMCGHVEFIKGHGEKNIEVKADCYNQILHVNSVEERKEFLQKNKFGRTIGGSIFYTKWLREKNIRFKDFLKYEDNYLAGIIKYSFTTCCYLPECLYYYRILSGSNSHAMNDMGHFERLRVEIEKIKAFSENGLLDDYYSEIREDFLFLFYTNTIHIIFDQFDEIPIDIIQSMRQAVIDLFPDYMEGVQSIKESHIVAASFLLTVYFNLTLAGWEYFKEIYLEALYTEKKIRLTVFCEELWDKFESISCRK